MSKDLMLSTWEDPEEDKPQSVLARVEPKRTVYHQIVYEMWEGGVRDLEEIRMETGYSVSYIRQLLREHGFIVETGNARPQKEIDEICHDYQTMPRLRMVLRKHNISNNTLYNILDSQGIPLKRNPILAQDAKQGAVELYEGNAPLKEIFNETGVSASVLYNELDAQGIPPHKQGNPRLQEAIDMYVDGVKLVEIQVQTGVSLALLYRQLAAKKIPSRRGAGMEPKFEKAVDMYVSGSTTEEIYAQTGLSTATLYRELARRNIGLRRGKAQGNAEHALELYDQGKSAKDITRITNLTVAEIQHQLRKRGGNLRTGLPVIVDRAHIELAVEGYISNVPVETIEIDTLVPRTVLYAELRKRKVALRP